VKHGLDKNVGHLSDLPAEVLAMLSQKVTFVLVQQSECASFVTVVQGLHEVVYLQEELEREDGDHCDEHGSVETTQMFDDHREKSWVRFGGAIKVVHLN
jgi:hypothetical protein